MMMDELDLDRDKSTWYAMQTKKTQKIEQQLLLFFCTKFAWVLIDFDLISQNGGTLTSHVSIIIPWKIEMWNFTDSSILATCKLFHLLK